MSSHSLKLQLQILFPTFKELAIFSVKLSRFEKVEIVPGIKTRFVV